jgi:hypothetical protein
MFDCGVLHIAFCVADLISSHQFSQLFSVCASIVDDMILMLLLRRHVKFWNSFTTVSV